MNQKGFATLEVILMVMVIGILASFAIPRFNNVTARANTAKAQSDMATISTAAAVYQMENGTFPTYEQLKTNAATYFENGVPQPPTGKIYVKGEIEDLGASDDYKIEDGKVKLGTHTADEITTKTPAQNNTPTPG